MELDIIILNELSQTEKNKYCLFVHVWILDFIWLSHITYQNTSLMRVFCLSVTHFYWIIWSFDVKFLEFFVYFGISSLSDMGLVKIFSHSVGNCLVLLTVLCFTEASQFQKVPFIN